MDAPNEDGETAAGQHSFAPKDRRTKSDSKMVTVCILGGEAYYRRSWGISPESNLVSSRCCLNMILSSKQRGFTADLHRRLMIPGASYDWVTVSPGSADGKSTGEL